MTQEQRDLIETVAHTMRTVADNLEHSPECWAKNFVQCNVHELRRDADELEKLLK